MSGSNKNPFEVFGLSPEMTAGLGEKDLFALVRAMYRAMQKFYHPDAGPSRKSKKEDRSTEKAVELNLAFERLNLIKDPVSFRKYRKAHAARRTRGLTKKISQLEKEVREKEKQKTTLADQFMVYLLRSMPWLQSGDEDRGRLTPQPTNIKLGLNDVAITQNIRSVSWSLGSNYKEIVFDALGAMFYRPVGRRTPFQANYIYLLGAVDTTAIDLLPLLDRVPPREGFFRSPALDSRYGIDGAPLQVLNTITMEKFKQYCLPHLRPDLRERAYLFSIHRPIFEKEGAITLEGVIVKISKP